MSSSIPNIIKMIESHACDLEKPDTDQDRMRLAHIAVMYHYGKTLFGPVRCYDDLVFSEERAEHFKKIVQAYIATTIKKEYLEALSANDTKKFKQVVERQFFAYVFAAEIKDREIARKKLREKKSTEKVVSASVRQDVPVPATAEEEVSALAEKLKQSADINDFVVVDEQDKVTNEENGISTEWELV